MRILPEMCRIADARSAVETLRGIAWISFILTILSGIACICAMRK